MCWTPTIYQLAAKLSYPWIPVVEIAVFLSLFQLYYDVMCEGLILCLGPHVIGHMPQLGSAMVLKCSAVNHPA